MAALPKPDEYQATSGEEDEVVLFEKRCRTHRWGPKKAVQEEEQHQQQEKVLSVPASALYTSTSVNMNGSTASTSGDDAAVATTTETAATATGADTATANGNADASCDKDATEATKAATSDSTEEKSASTAPAAGAWHDVGTGPLRVLRNALTHTCRLVQRREVTPNGNATKVLINLPVWKESTVTCPSEKHVQFLTLNTNTASSTTTSSTTNGAATATAAESLTDTLLFKCKLAEEAEELAAILRQQLAQAKSMYNSGAEDATGADTSKPSADGDADDQKAE
jgi:hypothetical protein